MKLKFLFIINIILTSFLISGYHLNNKNLSKYSFLKNQSTQNQNVFSILTEPGTPMKGRSFLIKIRTRYALQKASIVLRETEKTIPLEIFDKFTWKRRIMIPKDYPYNILTLKVYIEDIEGQKYSDIKQLAVY